MLDEQQFKKYCDQTLESLNKALTRVSDQFDFEADMNNGALSIEFEEPPAKFVVSPNTPVRQIWVSAHSRSFKLNWDAEKQIFILPDTGQNLQELIAQHISQHIHQEVTL